MEETSKQLVAIFMQHEGKDFDAMLQDNIEGAVGFRFMTYIHTARIHIQAGRITVSEPMTGKYFCLPLNGVREIQEEVCGEYDIAYTIRYSNDYHVCIQILQP